MMTVACVAFGAMVEKASVPGSGIREKLNSLSRASAYNNVNEEEAADFEY